MNYIPINQGVQIQQSWAYGHQVNLLAAGASTTLTNKSGVLNTGSGIYSGRMGALKAFTAINTPTTKILIAEVPKKPADQPANRTMPEESEKSVILPGLRLWKADLEKYNLTFLDFEENLEQAGSVCHGTICCDYKIRVSANNSLSEKATVRVTNTIVLPLYDLLISISLLGILFICCWCFRWPSHFW